MGNKSVDWNSIKTIHFVGIKGVAMTSLALYCLERGMKVTGSDVKDDFPTKDVLLAASISILEGFSKNHISGLSPVPDLVVYTGAHSGENNPEVIEARKIGIPVLAHGKALGSLMSDSIEVSVAGSHGKTTTSAMIATILSLAHKDPSYAIGCGSLRPIGNPGHFGKGKIFVAEADEYVTDPVSDRTPRFYWQHPDIFVVTNVDFDHPDAYGTIDDVKKAFLHVQKQEKGNAISIINVDDEDSSVLLHPDKGTVETYGSKTGALYRISNCVMKDGRTHFSLSYKDEDMGAFSIAVPGFHNALNAAGAIGACRNLSVSWEDIRKGLSQFAGTKRRFEIIGEYNDMTIVDDYAHHPKEIETTLSAASSWFPGRRIITVFQPHTFSRTRSFLNDFIHVFQRSSIVCITEIYASAREEVDPTMNGAFFVKKMTAIQKNVILTKTYPDAERYLDTTIRPHDVIIFLGAGDIADWGIRFFEHMKNTL